MVLLVVCALLSGIAAHLFYFSWDAPLVAGEEIDRFSYGPQGRNIREYAVHHRRDRPELLEELIEGLNRGTPVQRDVQLDDDRLLLVFFRKDGLQYHVFQDGPGFVGLSEGNRAYRVTLRAPGLSALLEDIAGDEDWGRARTNGGDLMLSKIDHLGIAVEDLDSALAAYQDGLGLPEVHREVLESQGVEAVTLDVGGVTVELLTPTREDSPVGRFLAKNGPGFHHVAYRVENIDETLAALKGRGVRLVDEEARIGLGGKRIAFLHPSSTAGVLSELVQAV